MLYSIFQTYIPDTSWLFLFRGPNPGHMVDRNNKRAKHNNSTKTVDCAR